MMGMKVTTKAKRKAYSYIRFSSKKQEQGDSLRRQTKAAQDFCERFNLELSTETYQDLGVSALRGKNAHAGNLRAFLQACQDGKVERGSVLIVENLDRLSRQQIVEATTLFLEIIDYVDIGVSQPPAKIYNKTDLNESRFAIFEVQLAFVRANEESAVKSDRLRKVWAEKQRKAGSEILTSQCPAWMILSEDKECFILLEDRVKLIREIYTMCIEDGFGVYTITHTLNKRNEPVWGRGKVWQECYVQRLLNTKAVLGTYVQHKRDDRTGGRKTNGVEIENYYPSVIDEATYRRAQAALASRKGKGGRRGYAKDRTVNNLFTGLLTDAYTGCPVHFLNKGRWQYLSPSYCKLGKVGYYMAWEYADFESLFLVHALNEEYLELMHEADSWQASKIDKIRAEIDTLKSQLDNVSRAIAEVGPSESLKRQLVELESDQTERQQTLNRFLLSQCASDEEMFLFAFDEQLGPRLRSDSVLRNKYRAILERTFSKIEVFFEGDDEAYIANRAQIQQGLNGKNSAHNRELVKFMKLQRFIRVHYRNGATLDLFDDNRFIEAEAMR